jgi:hypothetical protein
MYPKSPMPDTAPMSINSVLSSVIHDVVRLEIVVDQAQ